MAKRRGMNEQEYEATWEALPQSDKRFINTLILIMETIGDKTLRYHELPTRLERVVREADRDTLMSIIVECVGLLLGAPAMERVKQSHRRRNGTPTRTETNNLNTAGSAPARRSAKRGRSK